MPKRRILVIDDSTDIQKDFARILCPEPERHWDELARLEAALFGKEHSPDEPGQLFELEAALQGSQGVAKVQEAMASGRPYSLVFLDYRMPPGWNGFETLRQLRKVAPRLPVVLCSAFSDYSWAEMIQEFGEGHLLMELRKPFNKNELYSLAVSLTEPGSAASPA
jgi:CheY-like chemotaxis protein